MKKTLIFYGSPRKNGHTARMTEEFKKHLKGEIEIVDTYRLKNISPCLDCRACWKKPECAIKDGMTEFYEKIDAADNFIFAAPMYFHSIPGPMKIFIDRFQVYWAAHVRKDKKEVTKKAAIAMVGGAPEFKRQFIAGKQLLESVAADLSAEVLGSIELSNSDRVSLDDFPELKEQIKEIAEKLER